MSSSFRRTAAALFAACIASVESAGTGTLLVADAAVPTPNHASGSLITPGSTLWVKRYNGPANFNHASAVAVSREGSKVFVTGGSTGTTTGIDYATIAYSASTGAKLWVRRYNGPGNGQDFATNVASSPDGSRVFVTGESTGSSHISEFATISYDATTGRQLWVARYNGPAANGAFPAPLAVSPDGSTLFVAGWESAVSGDRVDAVVAYDASTGAQLWVVEGGGYGIGAVAVSPDGSKLFVTGVVEVAQGGEISDIYETDALDASTGTGLWVATYNGPDSNAPTDSGPDAIAVSPDSSIVFVAGSSSTAATSYDYATVAYHAATGVQLWVARYNGPSNTDDRVSAHGLVISPDGSRVFVTGASAVFNPVTGGIADYATVAYKASSGAQLWVKRYRSSVSGNYGASAAGVSPDGSKVFVTGSSAGSTSGYDYGTIAYDASTGAKLWVKRYNGPAGGNDYARSLGVSPDGSKVFVTGHSLGSTNIDAFATVAYSAN